MGLALDSVYIYIFVENSIVPPVVEGEWLAARANVAHLQPCRLRNSCACPARYPDFNGLPGLALPMLSGEVERGECPGRTRCRADGWNSLK